MSSNSFPSESSNPDSENRDLQTDAQSLERIKQILLGDRLDQIMQQLHDIDAHLSQRLTTLEKRLDEQHQAFNQKILQELAPLRESLELQAQQQNSANQSIHELQNSTTELYSRLDRSNQGAQQLQSELESQTQAFQQEIQTVQSQHQQFVAGLSQSLQQLAQDL